MNDQIAEDVATPRVCHRCGCGPSYQDDLCYECWHDRGVLRLAARLARSIKFRLVGSDPILGSPAHDSGCEHIDGLPCG